MEQRRSKGRFVDIREGTTTETELVVDRQTIAAGAPRIRPAQVGPSVAGAQAAEPNTAETPPVVVPSVGPLVVEKRPQRTEAPTPNSISGKCVDGEDKALDGVEVTLYRVERGGGGGREVLATTKTDAAGHYEFKDVVDIAREYPNGVPNMEELRWASVPLLQVVARKPGRATASQMDVAPRIAQTGVDFNLEMPAAATLNGRVTDTDGRPVEGAEVVVGDGLQDLGSLYSARTDADGRYEITDLAPYDLATAKQQQEELARQQLKHAEGTTGTFVSFLADRSVRVTHPAFAAREVRCGRIPGTLDVQLDKSAVVTGVVVDGETGRGVPNARIVAASSRPKSGNVWQGIESKYDKAGYGLYYTWKTTTDANGRYRFENLPAMAYDVWDVSGESKNRGLDRVEAVAGEVTEAPELKLSPGGTVRVRLVDSATNEPLPPSELQRTGFVLLPQDGVSARQTIVFSAVEPKDEEFDLEAYPGEFQAFCAGIVRDGRAMWVPDIQAVADVPTVKVVAGEVTSLDLRMAKPTTTANFDVFVAPGSGEKE